MRALTKNLEGMLAKNDPRWLAFGLNMPGTSVTPGRPVNVTAQLDETGAIVAQCAATALATRYRWRTRIAGGAGGISTGGEHDGAAGGVSRGGGWADGGDHRAGGECALARGGE